MKKKRFFINGILSSAVGLALRTVALVFAAYVSRTVGAEGVGLNTLIVSAYGFALTFATSGISLTVTRLVASHIGEGRECENGRILRGAMIYALIFSGVASIALASFSGIIATSFLGDVRAILPLQVLSLSLVPTALLGVISGYFVARRAVVRNSAVQLFSQAVRIGATVALLIIIGKRGVAEAALALALGITISETAALLVALLLFAIDTARERQQRSRGVILMPVAKTALPLALSSYVRSGLLSVEHSIIPRRLKERGDSSGEALSSFGALHGMALPIIVYPMSPLSSFATLLMPEFAEAEGAGDKARMSRIARSAISATLTYAILSAVLLFVFSEELGYAIYGSYSAGYFISVLAPVVPVMYLDHVVDSMLKGIGEQVYSMWVNIADSALSVLLVWLLIPALGIEGYAVVIIAMEVFNLAFSYIRLSKRISIRNDLAASLLVPSLSALGAAILAEHLFISGGSMPAVAVVTKLIFSVCLFTLIKIALDFALRLFRRKEKIEDYHQGIAENK